MATRTATFDASLTAPWSFATAPLKLWAIVCLVYESYGEALEQIRKAERRGLIVE